MLAREALIPNPALGPFSHLIGSWTTVGTYPYVPGTVFHGRTSFERLDGGAFLVMRDAVMTWSRSSPDFSQRMAFTLSADGRTMHMAGELSKDGGVSWEPDLELTYTRIE